MFNSDKMKITCRFDCRDLSILCSFLSWKHNLWEWLLVSELKIFWWWQSNLFKTSGDWRTSFDIFYKNILHNSIFFLQWQESLFCCYISVIFVVFSTCTLKISFTTIFVLQLQESLNMYFAIIVSVIFAVISELKL